MTVLPDPGRSRAVLIGASTYSHLENLPAVDNNLAGFRDILIDPALGGLSADKCVILEEPRNGLDVYRALRRDAMAAEDTLLVYFAGHGRTGARNELYLCLPDTNPDELSFTALAYEQLREAVADSRATKKVVILDCCFSGRAIADQAGAEETVVGQVGIEGSYILTATAANAVALAPAGERYTAFTGTLLNLLRTGIPDGPELLTFAAIYPHLRFTLTSRQLPQPRQQGSDTIAHLALSRNPAYARHSPTSHPQSRSSAGVVITPTPLPENLAAHLASRYPSAEGNGIFVSYRRQESSHLAGRLYDRLVDRFSEAQVFMDVDTIAPGVDFAEEIFRAVASCKVLLAIIGPNWLTAADERGHRRLDDPRDIVRLEIEAALARDVQVILIVVEGAVRPGIQDLPESLAGLTRCNALLIGHESFRYDAGRLVTAIERILSPAPAAPAPSGPAGEDTRAAGIALGERAQKGSGPARSDPGRAARLFTDAERIANSITDESEKRLALSHVVKALAATDPSRAERIANSITDKTWKARALSHVAKALAATDPSRAERIANSITDKTWKTRALSDVAKALAATDPSRAARLFTDAERIANRIADKHEKAWELYSVARALAVTDSGHAERIANSITDESAKASALYSVAEALATTDPDRAERIANSITHKKAEDLSDVAKALAATDPDRAARLFTDAERIANRGYNKAFDLKSVAKALAVSDPDDAERIANYITDADDKALALSQVAKALAAIDPDRAARLFTDAERIANSITDESKKGVTLSHVVRALATTDPSRAERIANSITADFAKETALSYVAGPLAATDPDRAERIANSITSGLTKPDALIGVVKTLAATDPGRAERFANSITYTPTKADALIGIAEALAATSS